MKKLFINVVLLSILIVMCAVPVYAGVWDSLKNWGLTSAVVFALGVILSIGVIAKYTAWISKLLIGIGALFTNSGLALADGKVSADELKQAKADFVNVKNIFKAKPE